MEIEQVQEFIDTLNSIKEDVCSIDGDKLIINHNDGSFDIEVTDIDSISLESKNLKGTEVFIKSISNTNNILFYLFTKPWQSFMSMVCAVGTLAYHKLAFPLASFIVGYLLGHFLR